jgi:hypothetical protein
MVAAVTTNPMASEVGKERLMPVPLTGETSKPLTADRCNNRSFAMAFLTGVWTSPARLETVGDEQW